jgi:hypothetical protein
MMVREMKEMREMRDKIREVRDIRDIREAIKVERKAEMRWRRWRRSVLHLHLCTSISDSLSLDLYHLPHLDSSSISRMA